MGVRGQLSGFPPPIIGSLVATIRSRAARSRAELVRPLGRPLLNRTSTPGAGRRRSRPPELNPTPLPNGNSIDVATMGCTSSAPNMTPSLSHSEKDLKFLEEADEKQMKDGEEKEVNHEKGKESNGIQVLPTCDTLGDSTHLDRHSKSLVNTTSSADLEQDSHMNKHFMEHENENISKDTSNLNADTIVDLQKEEKLSTLEEVVEKVVELYVENGHETKPAVSETVTAEDKQVKIEEHKQEEASEKQEEDGENKEAEEEAEEVASPSQSQSSRATRWEALADIAAELPPSLAVDPVTGQIYALSK